MDAGSGGLLGVEPLCRAHYSVSPSPILTSGNWQVGAGSQPGGGKGEKGRKGKMSRDGGGVAEPMEGWKRRCDRGEWSSPETEVDLSLECEDKERRNAGSATRFTALLGISGDRAAENGFHY